MKLQNRLTKQTLSLSATRQVRFYLSLFKAFRPLHVLTLVAGRLVPNARGAGDMRLLRRTIIYLLMLLMAGQSNWTLAAATRAKQIADSQTFAVARMRPRASAETAHRGAQRASNSSSADEETTATLSRLAAAAFAPIFDADSQLPGIFGAGRHLNASLPDELARGLRPEAALNPDGTLNPNVFDPSAMMRSGLLAATLAPPLSSITDGAISRHRPALNGGRIEGSLRVFSGETFAINSAFQLTGDLYTVGTPTITVNSGASHGGTINDGGTATPSGYQITLNSGTRLPGKIHTRANALSLPSDIPSSVPAPAGTRTVNLNSPADVSQIGNWATLRDLNVTPANLVIDVPPGNYGTFTLNGNSRLNFSAGTYNFSGTINLNSGSTIRTTGGVIINIGQDLNVNNGSIVPGDYTSPADVRLNVLGGSLSLNNSSQITALVRAINANVNFNGPATVRGQLIANYLNLNSGQIIGAVWPAKVGSSVFVYGPRGFVRSGTTANQFLEQFSLPPCVVAPFTLHVQNGATDGTNRVTDATVKLNGATLLTATDINQNVGIIDRTISVAATNTIEVTLPATAPVNSYLTVSINGIDCTADTAAPSVAITAPANNSTTTAAQTNVTGTASDTGNPATGVAHVYLNNIEAAYNAATGTWTLNNVALNLGANQLAARAVDNAGNQSTAQITVTRQAAPVDNTPPSVNISAPANNSTTTNATTAVSGTATDTGANASGVAAVTVNGTAAQLNAQTGAWSLASFALNVGANTLTVRAVDNAGNAATASVVVTRQQPDTQAPGVNITTPANNSQTTQATVTVSGTAIDSGTNASGVASVTVNGVSASFDAATGNWTLAGVSLSYGANTITAQAVDRAGNTGTGTITVTRQQPDTQAPDLAITQPAANAQTQAETTNVAGTVADAGANASGVASVTVNGAATQLNTQAGTWSLANLPLSIGANVITVRAADNAGNQTTRTITVTRKPVDTQPPTVIITSPSNQFITFDPQTVVSGTATDDGEGATGVKSVTVNGIAASYDAATQKWTATIALNEGSNTVTVVAIDNAPAANQAQAQVQVVRQRVEPPVLNITNPANGAFLSTPSLTVAGTVSSNKPDMPLTVKVNGQDAAVSGGQFTKTLNLVEGVNTITVLAIDALNQQTQSSITVTNDRTPPTIVLINVPPTAQPGASYLIQAQAADAYGIAGVDFMVDGVFITSVAAAPYQFTLAVPAVFAPGHAIVISAVARDLTGATAQASAQTVTTGPGGLTGYTFDDMTGYVLPTVTALLNGQDTVQSDENGLYSFVSSTPAGYVRLRRDGYTPIERVYSVGAGAGTEIFDARLTPVDPQANQMAVGGGTATGDGGRLQTQLGANSFPAGTDVRLTPVSPQGLINLLPFGWSPIPGAIFDLRALNQSVNTTGAFQIPARLTISQVAGLNEGMLLVLARYDETTHGWMVIAKDIPSGQGGALAADLPGSGQYAFLIADTGATAPPAAESGQPLPAGPPADSAALDAATATAVSSPASALYSGQAKSTISFVANASSKLPSGVAIEASFDETYVLLADRNPLLVDRPAQDFVLYAYPAATDALPYRLGAFFVAKPTQTNYSLTELLRANVHVEIRSGRIAQSGSLVTATGGIVRAEEGAQLEIPAGALSTSQPVFFNRVSIEQAGITLPEGYEIVAAFDLNLAGNNLSRGGGVVSFPVVGGDNSRLVVARVLNAGGQRGPKVVARAVESNGRINTVINAPVVPAGISLSGINTSGRYLFIRVPHPFGYVTGTVTNSAASGPATNVKVSTDRAPFIDLTGTDAAYTVIGAAVTGTNQLSGASLTSDATGQAGATLSAQDAVSTTPLSLSSAPLQVLAVTPAAGAGSVIVTTPVTVTFNKPVAGSTLTGSSFRLATANGNPVIGSITVLAGSRSVVLTPSATLAASTTYKVLVGTAVRDIYGKPLAASYESSFTTAAIVAVGDRLRAEQIKIAYPNAEGLSEITIPAHSVPEGATLVAVNNSSGATISVTAGANSISIQLQAQVGDEIELIVRQADGTEYHVKQSAYKRGDGFVSVGANGGTVTSDDGTILLDVPAGAISGQAHLKLTTARETDITIPRTGEMDPSVAVFGGGVKIEAQGTFTNTKELHLELAAPAGAQEGQRVFFMKPARTTFDGQETDVWETVTSGKVENGRIKSTSPPFLGVTLAGVLVGLVIATTFFVFFPPSPFRVVTGIVQKVNPGSSSTPIPGVECTVTSDAGNHPTIVTHTSQTGRFALANWAYNPTATVTVTATDPAGVEHLGVATPYLNTEPGLITIQTLFATVNFPSDYQGLSPAHLQFAGQMLNLQQGQRDTLQESGRVTTNSRIKLRVTATPTVQQFKGDLLVNGASPRQLVWTNVPQQGSSVYETEIEVVNEGTYSVAVTTHTIADREPSKATANYNFTALRNPNVRPELPGPPAVLSVTPADGAQQVDVGTRVHMEFSEPVKNLVAGQTVYLTQTGGGARIGGRITSGDLPVDAETPDISTIDFEPAQRLEGGKEYKLTVTSAVLDSGGEHLNQQPSNQQPQDFNSTFKTFQGLVLTTNPPDDDSYRIAALGDYAVTANVIPSNAYTPNGRLTVYDVTAPQKPQVIGSSHIPHRPLAVAMAEDDFSIHTMNAAPEYKRIVVVTTTATPDTVRPNNLWIFSIDEPEHPKLIGCVSLSIPQASVEIPGQLTIHNKRAYIGTVSRGGCVVVDIVQAIADFQRDVYYVLGNDTPNPFASSAVVAAVSPQGGYDREAQRQKASYGSSVQDASPVMGLSVIDQNVQSANGPQVAPVAYVVPNKPQLVSFNFDPSRDGILNYYDGDHDGHDDRLLAMKDLSPAGYPSDVKAVSGVLIRGSSKDLAVEVGGNRLWIFDVTNPSAPAQYPSKTFAELGLEETDTARRIELEGTTVYVMFENKVAVVDISDPSNPYIATVITGIGTGLRWIAVQDGFVYTLASDAGNGKSGIHVSIGRAVAQVVAYGIERDSPQICGNPVVVDRNTRHMAQSAGIFFQVYGHDLPQAAKVIIRKVNISGERRIETVLDTVPGVLQDTGTPNITTGEAVWLTSNPIDQAFIYTAEVVLDQGQGGEFHSKQTEIPFSYLIPYMSPTMGIKANGDKQTGKFSYMLAGTANVKLEIEGVRQTFKPQYNPDIWDRPFGVNGEEFNLPAKKPDGRYRFVFTATLKENPSVVDVVEGEVIVGNSSTDLRKPGSPIINGVELGTGNLAVSVPDIEIKGRGLSLSLMRFYNSQSAGGFNPLGYGWRHNYQVLLMRVAERDLNNNLTGEVNYSLVGGEGSGQKFKQSRLAGGKMPAEAPYLGTLVKNGDGSFDYFPKSHLKYHFREAMDSDGAAIENIGYMGNLDYIEEPNGNRISLRYDGSGRMDQVRDSSGRVLKFEYELAETPFVGIIAGSASTGGCVRRDKFKQLLTSLQQSRIGRAWRIKKVMGPGGLSLTYEYDGNGNLNFVRRAGYDDISSLTSDRVWQYGYNPAPPDARFEHLLKSVQAPNHNSQTSRITTYEYDLTKPTVLPVKKINLPEGVPNTFAYEFGPDNSTVTKASVWDGNNQKTTYTLDAGGRATDVAGPRGDSTTLTWTDFGQLKSKLDAEGMITTIEYDENQNARWTTIFGLGKTIKVGTKYDPTFSKLTQLQDGKGNLTNYRLDGKGNVREVELPTGSRIILDYFPNGDVQRVVDEYGFVTTYENYDANGNAQVVTRQTGSGSVITQNTYDARSRLLTSADTLAPSVANTYDALDRIIEQSVADPSGYREQMSVVAQYLPEGQLKTLTRSGGGQSLAVVNKYDGLTRLRETTETASGAGGFTRSFTYDNNSNLLTETDRRGVTITRTYDALNFQRSETLSGSLGGAVTTWSATGAEDVDKLGNPRRMLNQYGQLTELEYDGLHRLKLRKLPGEYTEETAYDDNSNVISTKDRNQHETTMRYDALNRLAFRHDPAGRETTWTYDDSTRTITRRQVPQGLTEIIKLDALDRPLLREVKFAAADYRTTYEYDERTVRVTDARGTLTTQNLSAFGETGQLAVSGAAPAYVTQMSYAAFGALKSAKDANGRTTSYTVDGFNRTTGASYQGGFTQSWSYDGEGLLTSHTDRRGIVSLMTYDNAGRRLATRVNDAGRAIAVETIAYDDSANTRTVTDASNHRTLYHYDGLRRVDHLTNADSKTRSFVYDGEDLLEESDFSDRRTKYAYDAVDRVNQITDRKGQVTLIAYDDSSGLTKSITDRRANRQVEVYDPLGRLVSRSEGSLPLVQYEYDGNNNRVSMTDGLNHRTTYNYDALNRLQTANHAGSKQIETYGYDAVGNMLRYNDGRGPDLVMEYDVLNYPKKRVDGAGNATFYTYDGEGLLREKTDPKGAQYKTSYTYNGLRSLKSVTDAAQGLWEFTYDDAQNLTSVKDPRNHTVGYEYDALNRLQQVTQPGDLKTVFGYDGNSNRTSITDPKSQVATLTYDALDRPDSITYSGVTGAGPRSYSYTYDPEANLTKVTETLDTGSPRTYQRTYDARNRLETATDPFNRVVTYGHDAANNLTSIKDAQNNKTSYAYDGLNRLQTVTLPNNQSVGYDWYADGLLKEVSYAANVKRNYAYDDADRLTSVVNTTGGRTDEFAYTYDANSNREKETRKQDGRALRRIAYGYDSLNRLTNADYTLPAADESAPLPGQTRQFTENTRLKGYGYDATGNRSEETTQDRATIVTLTTDSEGHTAETRANTDGPLARATSQFDELNRLINLDDGQTVTTYDYDRNGNLLDAKQGGQAVASYEYDARDQLRRVAGSSNQTVAVYDYDCERQRLSKTVGTNTWQYAYGAGHVIGEYGNSNQLVNRYDYGAGELVRAELNGEGERFYSSDGLGSITTLAQVGTSSNVTASYEYDAWGGYLSAGGASYNSFGYTGQKTDSETGLMPLGNGERYYAANHGRFIQQDSFGGWANETASLNRYSYAHDNPTKYTDPSGHVVGIDDLAAILLIGFLASVLYGVARQDAEIKSGRRKQTDFSLSEAIIYQGLPGAVLAPAFAYTGAVGLAFGAGFSAYGVYQGVQEVREGRGDEGRVDIIFGVVGLLLAGHGAYKEGYLGKPTSVDAYVLAEQTRTPQQLELPFEPAAEVGPRQPELPFGEPVRARSSSAGAEEPIATDSSRQMKLPFDGTDPEQLSLDFPEASKTGKLMAGSQAHKAQRWQGYQDRGGAWSYERWSNVYEQNMKQANLANEAMDAYHEKLGWGQRELTVDVEGVSRRLDIGDKATMRGIEHKTGYQSKTTDNMWEIQRDSILREQGWDIKWHFEGQASKPLLKALDDAGIPYTGGRK
jgi:RHS repeat-associated protein